MKFYYNDLKLYVIHISLIIIIVKLLIQNFQIQRERDDLYNKFIKAINEVQQKSSLKNLLLEKKLNTLADSLEKKEAQLNEVLSASNLDPAALSVVTRKLEVKLFVKKNKRNL